MVHFLLLIAWQPDTKNISAVDGSSYYIDCEQVMFKIIPDFPFNLIALSNMPSIEEKLKGNLKTVYFEESPNMSTYSDAIFVGLFDFVGSHTSVGTLFVELWVNGPLYLTILRWRLIMLIKLMKYLMPSVTKRCITHQDARKLSWHRYLLRFHIKDIKYRWKVK